MKPGTWVVVLVAAAVLLGGCGSGSSHSGGDKTLLLPAPNLVKIKKSSDVPNCPKVAQASVSDGMPSVTLSCLGGGRAVDVAGLRGPMIVNFWASWCGACHTEMPALATYAKSQSAVRVVGVDYLDPHPDSALELAKKSKVAYPLVADPNGDLDRASPLPHISALPMTVFIAANGSISHIEAKAYDSEQDVAAAARKYLGTSG